MGHTIKDVKKSKHTVLLLLMNKSVIKVTFKAEQVVISFLEHA